MATAGKTHALATTGASGSRAYIKSQAGFVVKFVGVTSDNDMAKHDRTPINNRCECAKMGKNVSLRATFY